MGSSMSGDVSVAAKTDRDRRSERKSKWGSIGSRVNGKHTSANANRPS